MTSNEKRDIRLKDGGPDSSGGDEDDRINERYTADKLLGKYVLNYFWDLMDHDGSQCTCCFGRGL